MIKILNRAVDAKCRAGTSNMAIVKMNKTYSCNSTCCIEVVLEVEQQAEAAGGLQV